MRISDWSSDVCSSDLVASVIGERGADLFRRFASLPAARCAGLFLVRELLLRSGDRVRFLRLSPSFQLWLLAGVVATAAWAVAMTTTFLRQSHVIAVKEGEIADAHIAYEDLLDEVTNYQQRVAQVTGSLRENQLSLLRYMAQIDTSSDVAAVLGSNPDGTSGKSVLAEDGRANV